MEPQPEIAVQGLSIGDRCPCDDGRPDECTHVINAENLPRIAAMRDLQMVATKAASHMTYQEASEIVLEAYSAVERA